MLRLDEDIPFVEKPWGYERIWIHTEKYAAKYVFLAAGHKTSRKYHEIKDKTVFVLEGPLSLELGPDSEGEEILSIGVVSGESYHITPGSVYRFCAPEEYDVELMIVSTPEMTDVIRIEDDYGRMPEISA